MNKLIQASIISILLSFSFYSQASNAIAIVVHPDNHSEFDERIARQIFLGQVKSFPNGNEARPYTSSNEELHNLFISKVLRRNPHTMNAYWARMIFTAKATPPRDLPDADAIKKMVASSVHAIGYLPSQDVDDNVRVIAIIE